ncbi:MAG: hypothetical protein IIX06_06545, partial [Bacteroidales bacterium]|nr:hypothetical protein [Bacteroidales bacterium]
GHINAKLFVSQLQYTTSIGQQKSELSEHEIERGDGFKTAKTRTQTLQHAQSSKVPYDLIGKVAEGTKLTRKTVAAILSGIDPQQFYKFRFNPEEFISKVVKLINEQKATMIVEHISYDETGGPLDAFNKLILSYRRFEPATAMIGHKAEIGEGTIIEPGVFIGDKVKIGKNCIIHPNVTIYNHVIIGDNVIIQSGSVIGGDACYFQRRPDGFVKFESCGRVIIEDDVEIGACCCVDIGVTSDTIVGKGTKMDNFVQIGHDAKLGKNCFLGAHASVGGVTVVKDNVSIWAMGSVNKDLVIAEGTVVLAYSGVDKDTLPGKTYFGVPADEAMKKWREIATIKALSNK